MKAEAKTTLQGVLLGCLGGVGGSALMLTASPGPAAQAAATAEVRAQAPGVGCCRWEVVPASPWQDGPAGGAVPPAPHAVTLLLDQCSGSTWALAFGRGGLEWRAVAREWPGP